MDYIKANAIVNGMEKTTLLNLDRIDRIYPSNAAGNRTMVVQGADTLSVDISFAEFERIVLKRGQLHLIADAKKVTEEKEK